MTTANDVHRYIKGCEAHIAFFQDRGWKITTQVAKAIEKDARATARREHI